MNIDKIRSVVSGLPKEDVEELASEHLGGHVIELGGIIKEISERDIELDHPENNRLHSLFSEYKSMKEELQKYGVFEDEYQRAFDLAVSDRKFDPSVFGF